MHMVTDCLIYAGVIRLMISTWVFSNPNIFDYLSIFDVNLSSSGSYYTSIISNHSKGYLPDWMESRLIRSNVFPIILVILLLILMRLLLFIYSLNPSRIIGSYMKCLVHACRNNKVHAEEGVLPVRGFDLFTSSTL